MPRPKIEDAEERLLASGLSLFARDGTERVNTNSIARRAGVGIGTFYAHFEDKYALLREVQIRTLTGIRASRTAALKGIGADAAAQVEATVSAVVTFAARHPEAYRVTFARERPGTAAHGPVMSESIRPTAEGLQRLQRRGALPKTWTPSSQPAPTTQWKSAPCSGGSRIPAARPRRSWCRPCRFCIRPSLPACPRLLRSPRIRSPTIS